MRILFLSCWFPYPPDNGSKIRVYNLLRALGSRHDVTLLSLAFDSANQERADELSSFCAEVQAIRHDPYARSKVLSTLRFLSPVPIVNMPLADMTRAVRGVLDRKKFDVVIASTETMAAYALLTPRSTVRILEEHNSWSRRAWDRYREQSSALQRLRCWISWHKTRRYEARLFPKFDACVMVSERDQSASLQVLSGYDGRVEIVPNGVDCQRNRPGFAQPIPKTFIYNGALTYDANYDAMRYFLAEIYPLIQEQVPDASLTITGSTSNVNLRGLRLDESVHLSGYVDDMRPLVAGAWVCVVPIRRGGGTRLKILEAMALGTPVVSTSKGAEGLDVVHNHDILIANEPTEFASQVLHLLRDPALHRRLVANARHLVEQHYDWMRVGQHFVDIVEDVVHNRARGGTSG
jgi:glycosyltransferase involved in cell wall biosynthesis